MSEWQRDKVGYVKRRDGSGYEGVAETAWDRELGKCRPHKHN